jgi:hypothetical protein
MENKTCSKPPTSYSFHVHITGGHHLVNVQPTSHRTAQGIAAAAAHLGEGMAVLGKIWGVVLK